MTESKSTTPKGVQTADAPTKAAPVTSPVDANKKPNTETVHKDAPKADLSTDTPVKDTGAGGTVATTGNQSIGKVAEPGTANTPNPPPTAAGLVDTPPAGGLETPSGGVQTPEEGPVVKDLSGSVKSPVGGVIKDEDAGKPIPADKTPIPDDETLDKLDAKLGHKNGLNDEEVLKTAPTVHTADDPEDVDEAMYAEEKQAALKIVQLVAALPETTPDSGIFGGYGGVVVNYGDLRRIARAVKRGLDE